MSHIHPRSSESNGFRLRESSELEAAANMSGVGRSESLSWDCDSCSFSCTIEADPTRTHTGERVHKRGRHKTRQRGSFLIEQSRTTFRLTTAGPLPGQVIL